jgi:hypothetical protein
MRITVTNAGKVFAALVLGWVVAVFALLAWAVASHGK